MHPSSYERMEYFKKTLDSNKKLDILDIGAYDSKGNYNYSNIFNEKKWNYQGLDLKPGNNVDIVVEDPYNWIEIEDNSFDVIISGQAFEPIEFFWLTLEQIKRILKPGGIMCIIVPSTGPVHRNPYDCWRFTPEGVKAFAKYIKFEIIETGSSDIPLWKDSSIIAKKPKSDKH